jgi:hypothetical protein
MSTPARQKPGETEVASGPDSGAPAPAISTGQSLSAALKKRSNLRVAFLCDYNSPTASTVRDSINAIRNYSRHTVVVLPCLGGVSEKVNLADFDVILIHYSLTLAIDAYVSPSTRSRLKAFKGLKAVIIQDEYRFIDRTIAAMRDIGVNIVFSCMERNEIPKVYPSEALPGARIETVLAGYVPQWLTVYETVPWQKRRIDVGYRGRSYPAWHGEPGRDRIYIGQRFQKDAAAFGLKTDIKWRERDRLYGADWVAFMRSTKAQLCTESSIGVFDRDGTISSKTEVYSDLVYKKKRDYDLTDAQYAEIRDRFFADREGEVETSLVSPRALEAAAIRTLLIMYEGRYSGVFSPWRHYVPLKKDHSNMAEVAATLKDPIRAAEIVATAYAEIAQNPRYSGRYFVDLVDRVFEEEISLDHLSAKYSFDPETYNKHHAFNYVDNPYSVSFRPPRFRHRVKQRLMQSFRGVVGFALGGMSKKRAAASAPASPKSEPKSAGEQKT